MKSSKGKDILKRDREGLAFVSRSLAKELEKEMEECLAQQEKEITNLKTMLYEHAKQKFNSSSEFQLYVFKNLEVKPSF
ncbi:hypothetical protein [Aquimarina algiphila]|uniref:Uncharacterized protein n=1 Tax=Aquimarina algiphila TaxID=2047982 RepID=A0A554VK43_9FLAO|nr:hypothetical protein [Aquimarina algiphila]TSE08323.1 hypothetical protein FOF46_13075 [Aquimarina algiphila]